MSSQVKNSEIFPTLKTDFGENSDITIICKLNVEEAPLLRAAHQPVESYPIMISLLAEDLKLSLKSVGALQSSSNKVQFSIHPKFGCLLKSRKKLYKFVIFKS